MGRQCTEPTVNVNGSDSPLTASTNHKACIWYVLFERKYNIDSNFQQFNRYLITLIKSISCIYK